MHESSLEVSECSAEKKLSTFVESILPTSLDGFLSKLSFGEDHEFSSLSEKRAAICRFATETSPSDPLEFLKDLDVELCNITSNPTKKIKHDAVVVSEDISIIIPKNLTPAQLQKKLTEAKIPHDTLSHKEKMKRLKNYLRANHPLHSEISKFNYEEVKEMISFSDEIPVRHNEETFKKKLASVCFEKSPAAPLSYLRKLESTLKGKTLLDLKSDYSVKLPDTLSEEEIRRDLKLWFNKRIPRGFQSTNLRKMLQESLIYHHPLQKHLETKTEERLASCVIALDTVLPDYARTNITKRRLALANYCFQTAPTAPLQAFKNLEDNIDNFIITHGQCHQLPLSMKDEIAAHTYAKRKLHGLIRPMKKQQLLEIGEKLGINYQEQTVEFMKKDLLHGVLISAREQSKDPTRMFQEICQMQIQVVNEADVPLSVHLRDKGEIVQKLREFEADFDESEDVKNLLDQLLLHEGSLHPIHEHLQHITGKDLSDLAATMSITPKETENMLRARIALAFMECNPEGPLSAMDRKLNHIRGVDRIGQYSLGFSGRNLQNVANSCYLNSLLNGLFSFKNTRRDLLLASDTPACSQVLDIFNSYVPNACHLRTTLNAISPHNQFIHGQLCDPKEALEELIKVLPYHGGVYKKTMEYSQCATCKVGTVSDKLIQTTVCESFPRRENVQAMLNGNRKTTFETCRTPTCDARNIPVTETWEVTDVKDNIIIASERGYGETEFSPCYPDNEIVVDDEYFKISAVICYRHANRHYYTCLKLGENWYEVNDTQQIQPVPAPLNGYMFFYQKPQDFTNIAQGRVRPPTGAPAHNFTSIGSTIGRQSTSTAQPQPIVEEQSKHPEVSKDFEVNLNKLRSLREVCITELNENKVHTADLVLDNPLLAAGFDFHTKLREKYSQKADPCIVCKNQDYDLEIMPRKKMCHSCNAESLKLEKLDPHSAKIGMFSEENGMNPTPMPPCISRLSRLELEAIRMISPQTSIYCRKGGKLGHVGHVIGNFQHLYDLFS